MLEKDFIEKTEEYLHKLIKDTGDYFTNTCTTCHKPVGTFWNGEYERCGTNDPYCHKCAKQLKERLKIEETEQRTVGYQVQCNRCGYAWDTKYARVPAKCPSCAGSIYNNPANYTLVTRYLASRQPPCCGAVMIIILTFLLLLIVI